MKIALVNTFMPFLRGGAEVLVDDLYQQLKNRGHSVTLFRMPFPNDYEVGLMELVLASKLLDFTAYDRIIAFKFPGYCVCHPQKSVWLFHQFRQVYDLFDVEDGLPKNENTLALKSIIEMIDSHDLRDVRNCTVIGSEVERRLKKYNDIPSDVVHPPLPNAERYFCSESSDYFYYPSRVTKLKRQHLVVEAMRYVKTDVKLVLTGQCKEPEYEDLIRSTIQNYGLKDRVFYQNIWLEEEKKLKLLAESLGVIFIPYHEDYGYITLEAYYAGKPMITCTDSGSPVGFVKEGKTGYVVDPTPEVLAEKMDLLYRDREKTIEMGQNARREIERRNITWDETVRRLLS